MKTLQQYINEYLIKKKIDKIRGIQILYTPKTKYELKNNIKELLNQGETDLNYIDTSNITDMSELFWDIEIDGKNIDVSKWDVSNVKNMKLMFRSKDKFNCDLSNWDVSNVEEMDKMFDECYEFEGNGLENWNVSNVKYTNLMFHNCFEFNCDLSNWDVSNVEDMRAIFVDCKSFEGKGLDKWDVSNVKDMGWMFYNCKNFDCDLEHWNVSNVKDMEKIFDGCTSLKTKPSWYK